MRINIITQPLFCNYGGILQNYALQEVLRRLGHEPLTVNTPVKASAPKVLWKDAVKTVINFVKKINGQYDQPFLSPYKCSCKERELSFPQRKFIENHINKVDVKPPFTNAINKDFPSEAWIAGSDQVWRPWCSHYIENCFLDFVDDSTRKVAYAASFGTDKWEISPEMTERLAPLAGRFDAVSVRESSGIELCSQYLGITAEHVLDPTMLLSAEDYLALTTENDYPHERYIATYILDNNKTKRKEITRFAELENLKVQPVGRMRCDRFDSVENWLATIAHAEYVITDSFHGTVFSIIFGRPVKILGNDVRGNARLESLLSMFSLKENNDRIYYPSLNLSEKLEELRIKSVNFLTEALS